MGRKRYPSYAVAVWCRWLGTSRYYAYYQYQATKPKSVAHDAVKYWLFLNATTNLWKQKHSFYLTTSWYPCFSLWHYLSHEVAIIDIKVYAITLSRTSYGSNSAVTGNYLQCQFDVGSKQQIIVADLTYICVNHHCKLFMCTTEFI